MMLQHLNNMTIFVLSLFALLLSVQSFRPLHSTGPQKSFSLYATSSVSYFATKIVIIIWKIMIIRVLLLVFRTDYKQEENQ